MATEGQGNYGDGSYGDVALPPPFVPDVAAAKKSLQTQILLWRTAGWSWAKIKSGAGSYVWRAYTALGGQ